MTLLRKFIEDKRGDYVSLFIALFAIMAFSLLFAEYWRIIDHREEVENIIQRGINVALEDMLRDTMRWDFQDVLDTGRVWGRLDQYFRAEMHLDALYRRMASDGNLVFRIEITSRTATTTPEPYVLVEGNIHLSTNFSLITGGNVVMPFRIRSRTVRLD